MKPGPGATTAAVLVLTLVWGTTWAAIRIGLESIPPLAGVSLRFGLAGLVLLLVGLWRGVPFGAGRHERGVWIANAILSFSVSYVVVYWCEQWVPSGLASVLWATFPLFLAVVAHFSLAEERLTLQTALGGIVGFGGVAVIFSEDFRKLGGPGVALAALVMLLSPLASAVSNVIIKSRGRDVHPISLAAVPMLMASVLVGALSLLFERGRTVSFTPVSVACLLYLALCGSALTFGLYYWLLAHHRVTKLGLISFGVPVVGVFVGAVFLHEPVTVRMLAGSGLVVAGVAVAVSRRKASAA